MVNICLFTTCEWCSKKLNSSVTTHEESYCSLKCQDYHILYKTIKRLLSIAIVNIFEMYVDKEWKNLFDFISKSNLSMYNHRRDDIGLEISWLYEYQNLSIQNDFETINSVTVCEHFRNLLYFLDLTKND